MPSSIDITLLRAILLRQRLTRTEKKLWKIFRNRGYNNLKFRRQHPIPPFIANFYCEELLLVVELDGESHESERQRKYDKRRDEFMQEKGIIVIRISDINFIEKPSILFDQIDRMTVVK